jgi:polyphenol oxidase
MFHLDPDGVLRAEALSRVPNLLHGFGTRDSDGWPPLPTATVRQVHSDRVVFAEGPGMHGEADALMTDRSGFALAIRTADCVPILIADPENHAVAAVHAGWRGTVTAILAKTLAEMSKRFGTKPEKVLVAIGPAIGPCCFEVGPEVAVQFGQVAEKTHVDLIEANRGHALAAGVPVSQITVSGHCTRCEPTLFHSFRRDREQSGRMVSAIGWID